VGIRAWLTPAALACYSYRFYDATLRHWMRLWVWLHWLRYDRAGAPAWLTLDGSRTRLLRRCLHNAALRMARTRIFRRYAAGSLLL